MAKEWIVPDADLGCDGAYFDYQELVRCRECKWFLNTGYGKNRKCYRPNHGGNGGLRMSESDYCSYGEREVQE